MRDVYNCIKPENHDVAAIKLISCLNILWTGIIMLTFTILLSYENESLTGLLKSNDTVAFEAGTFAILNLLMYGRTIFTDCSFFWCLRTKHISCAVFCFFLWYFILLGMVIMGAAAIFSPAFDEFIMNNPQFSTIGKILHAMLWVRFGMILL